jgi:hypothetical protein
VVQCQASKTLHGNWQTEQYQTRLVKTSLKIVEGYEAIKMLVYLLK